MPRVFTTTLTLLGLLLACGCAKFASSGPAAAPPKDSRGEFYLQPLPVQQAQAYGETVTGRFVSLADFEDAGQQSERGFNQLRHFRIEPAEGGELQYVVNITRTGAGAMRVQVPEKASLVFEPAEIHDFRPYALLSISVYSQAVRDDLIVTLTSPAGTWRSQMKLVPAGWSTVLVDLTGVTREMPSFDLQHVQSVSLNFSAATEAVQFNIDDIMLIDNARDIPGTPKGILLKVCGLDYQIILPGWTEPIELKQSPDGLWRLGMHQPIMQLGPPESRSAGRQEDLRGLGDRRVGAVEILECNAARLRIRNTWYFPPQAGEWIDMDVRQLRWEYTFYADGRWVFSLLLNNAGGEDVLGVRVLLPFSAAWTTGLLRDELDVRDFTDTTGTWSFLAAPDTEEGKRQKLNFAHPASLTERLGQRGESAPGDADGDGFDETQGCYFIRPPAGNCRLQLQPGEQPLVRPVIFLAGRWKSPPEGNCQGLPLSAVLLPDGAISVIPETLATPTHVEFSGNLVPSY